LSPAFPQRADVVVIGGGFAGAATAHFLGQQGVADIVLLEKEATCGYHASGRNAALCRQLTSDELFTDYTMRGAAFLREPPAGFADRPLLSRTGSVLLVDDAARLSELARQAAARRLPFDLVTPESLAQRWPKLADAPSAGGIFFATDGVIDVHTLLQSYLRGARDAGTRVIVSCEVTGFEPLSSSSDRVRLVTSRGTIDARCVVMAAGAWVEQLGRKAGASPRVFTPIHRHVFITEPVAGLDREAPFVWHLGEQEFYVRPEGSGYLLSGCDGTPSEPHDARVAAGATEVLAARLETAAPQLCELGIARAWACLRTFAPDNRPVIAWDDTCSWLLWVAGLGGHGATSSAAIGEDAATKLLARVR